MHSGTRTAVFSGLAWLCLAVTSSTAPAGDTQPVISNQRVVVWEVTAAKNAPPPLQAARDVVKLLVQGNSVDVTFEPKGTAHRAVLPAGSPAARLVVIELTDAVVPPLPNKTGFADAFPRPRAKRVLDNNRVVAWDYTWNPGEPTPMHFHDKDVVVSYLADGALTSTTPDGQSVVNEHYIGYTKFNPRDRTHTELLTKGQGRAIIVELK